MYSATQRGVLTEDTFLEVSTTSLNCWMTTPCRWVGGWIGGDFGFSKWVFEEGV